MLIKSPMVGSSTDHCGNFFLLPYRYLSRDKLSVNIVNTVFNSDVDLGRFTGNFK